VLGPDGNFYGTTASGGANQYYGTVFKIDRAGELTTLYRARTYLTNQAKERMMGLAGV
jgi:uncharacterized repeat protein (TIGR03803 family)